MLVGVRGAHIILNSGSVFGSMIDEINYRYFEEVRMGNARD